MTQNCILITKGLDSHGYARIKINGVSKGRHRVEYEKVNGPIPQGLQIDHLCRNRNCINPAHMEAVSPKENILRGQSLPANNARKSHCKNGHEFTKENTIIADKGKRRLCAVCRKKSYTKFNRKGSKNV